VSDSPFHPPVELAETAKGSWLYPAARVVVAFGVVAYSALLSGVGVLYALAILGVVIMDDSVPSGDLYTILAWSGALASVGVVGFGCAALLVFCREIALLALLVFAAYAMFAVLPLAFVQVWSSQSLEQAAQVIAVGSLGPMLCIMAFGALRVVRDRETL
jgi:hypothetical protein